MRRKVGLVVSGKDWRVVSGSQVSDLSVLLSGFQSLQSEVLGIRLRRTGYQGFNDAGS
jgi:hypothetical protein